MYRQCWMFIKNTTPWWCRHSTTTLVSWPRSTRWACGRGGRPAAHVGRVCSDSVLCARRPVVVSLTTTLLPKWPSRPVNPPSCWLDTATPCWRKGISDCVFSLVNLFKVLAYIWGIQLRYISHTLSCNLCTFWENILNLIQLCLLKRCFMLRVWGPVRCFVFF